MKNLNCHLFLSVVIQSLSGLCEMLLRHSKRKYEIYYGIIDNKQKTMSFFSVAFTQLARCLATWDVSELIFRQCRNAIRLKLCTRKLHYYPFSLSGAEFSGIVIWQQFAYSAVSLFPFEWKKKWTILGQSKKILNFIFFIYITYMKMEVANAIQVLVTGHNIFLVCKHTHSEFDRKFKTWTIKSKEKNVNTRLFGNICRVWRNRIPKKKKTWTRESDKRASLWTILHPSPRKQRSDIDNRKVWSRSE